MLGLHEIGTANSQSWVREALSHCLQLCAQGEPTTLQWIVQACDYTDSSGSYLWVTKQETWMEKTL